MSSPVTSLSGEYLPLPIDKVIYGAGSASRLGSEVDRLGCRRALIITGRTLAHATPVIRGLEAVLGLRHAGTYAGIRQHAPESGILAALQQARDCQADVLVAAGGGSPIDAAKAVAHRLAGKNGEASLDAYLPILALPTTLSAAEFSHVAGYTDETTRSKTGFTDPKVTPRVVFLDPELTLSTPMSLWLASGIRSLDHAVETLTSPGDHPISDTLALKAIRDLFEYLPRSQSEPGDPDNRLRCQLAAWMSYFSPASAPAQAGLSHTIGKRIGATYNVPHGVTSCILLPHVLEYQAGSEEMAARLAPAARSLGLSGQTTPDREATLAAAGAVSGLVRRLGLPARLREVGVPQEAFESIAQAMAEATTGDPRLVEAVIGILNQAW